MCREVGWEADPDTRHMECVRREACESSGMAGEPGPRDLGRGQSNLDAVLASEKRGSSGPCGLVLSPSLSFLRTRRQGNFQGAICDCMPSRAYADARRCGVDPLEHLFRLAPRISRRRNQHTVVLEQSGVDVRSGTRSASRPHASGLLPTRSRSDFAQSGPPILSVGGIALRTRVTSHGQDAAGTGSVC